MRSTRSGWGRQCCPGRRVNRRAVGCLPVHARRRPSRSPARARDQIPGKAANQGALLYTQLVEERAVRGATVPAAPTRCGSVWPLPNPSGARRKAPGASSPRRGSAAWKAQPSRFIRRLSRDPRFSGVPGLLRHPLRRLYHLRPGRTVAHVGSRPRPHPDPMSPAPSPAAARGGRSRLRAPRGHPRPVRAGLTRSRLVPTALRHAGTPP